MARHFTTETLGNLHPAAPTHIQPGVALQDGTENQLFTNRRLDSTQQSRFTKMQRANSTGSTSVSSVSAESPGKEMSDWALEYHHVPNINHSLKLMTISIREPADLPVDFFVIFHKQVGLWLSG